MTSPARKRVIEAEFPVAFVSIYRSPNLEVAAAAC
jgi:hypothetical protein